MRFVIQRVSEARVKVDDEIVSGIEKGFLVLVGISDKDTFAEADKLVNKLLGLRIFEDENQKMNLSLSDISGEILLVSQFTLYGDARKGKRPSFTDAARPEIAVPLYETIIKEIKSRGIGCKTGEFGADMTVTIVNDGPVTIMLDSKKQF